jgi:ATP-dependent RNA circularization protein (DNA/RNA ligase family)
MTADFFRFPHTPHLAWLGEGSPRDDKVLLASEVTALLAGKVVVEEKLDGANVGLSLTQMAVCVRRTGGNISTEPHAGQFARLPAWLAQHGEGLRAVLNPNLILFGEWCAARHSLDYAALPDWFLLFDVYDRSAGRFWSTRAAMHWQVSAGLVTVPQVLHGKTTFRTETVGRENPSHYRTGALEGVVIRRESADWCEARAKLVLPDFTQAIDTHWRKRAIEWNRIDYSAGAPE